MVRLLCLLSVVWCELASANVVRDTVMTVSGALPAPARSVTVNGVAAQTNGDLTFALAEVGLSDGQNTFTVVGENAYGARSTNVVQVSLPAALSLLYDANGNLTNDGTRSFAYDAQDRLVTNWVTGAWKSEFVYDGLGRRRIERDYGWQGGGWVQTNETRFIYDGYLLVQERDSNNAVRVTYTRGVDLSGSQAGGGGIGGLLARTDSSGTRYYHSDGAGNVTGLMEESGDMAARYLYGPFGRVVGKWGPMADANAMRFSSMPVHVPSGVSQYPFRGYDANLQRWLTRDPIGEAGGINLYGFVGNNPISRIDPYGLDYHLGGASGLLTPGPLGYLYGDTGLEQAVASGYNALPELGNLLAQVATGLGNALGLLSQGIDDSAKEGVKALGGNDNDANLVSGFVNAAMTVGVRCRGAAGLGAAKSDQMLFRGVPGNGTQKAILGQQGVAVPRGTALDEGSLIKHVLGEDVSAGVTSWTTDRAVAARFSGPGGTIIEVPVSKVSSQVVPRPPVPKYGGESEVLLRGTVQGTPTRP